MLGLEGRVSFLMKWQEDEYLLERPPGRKGLCCLPLPVLLLLPMHSVVSKSHT